MYGISANVEKAVLCSHHFQDRQGGYKQMEIGNAKLFAQLLVCMFLYHI